MTLLVITESDKLECESPPPAPLAELSLMTLPESIELAGVGRVGCDEVGEVFE
jgi:hypothetical protein